MHLVLDFKKADIDGVQTPAPKKLAIYYFFNNLPPALKTRNNMALLTSYFSIAQPSVRHFVLTLFARITDDKNTVYPADDISEAKYLIAHNVQLPPGEVRAKMLALVRQVCAANGGDKGGLYGGETQRLQ